MGRGIVIGGKNRRGRSRQIWVMIALLGFLMALVFVHHYTFDWVKVRGINMDPTLHHGDLLLLSKTQSPMWEAPIILANRWLGLLG